MSEKWIELEDGFLTNQKLIWVGRGKGLKQIPDPDNEPTKFWLFIRECRTDKRGRVTRIKAVRELDCADSDDMDTKIQEFILANDARLLPSESQAA